MEDFFFKPSLYFFGLYLPSVKKQLSHYSPLLFCHTSSASSFCLLVHLHGDNGMAESSHCSSFRHGSSSQSRTSRPSGSTRGNHRCNGLPKNASANASRSRRQGTCSSFSSFSSYHGLPMIFSESGWIPEGLGGAEIWVSLVWF